MRPRIARLAPGSRIGTDVEIIGELGHGAHAEVYLGRDVALRRFVAVKVLHADRAQNPSAVERFLREARVLSQISDPHVLPIFALGKGHDGAPYLVLEYVPGGGLDRLLETSGALPPTEAAAVVRQVALGLSSAHVQGIVHRDLKPANVLVVESAGQRRVKIADFGLARWIDVALDAPELTVERSVLGTPRYMAPEQSVGAPVDARADIYALGLVAAEVLTGRPAREAAPLGGRIPWVATAPSAQRPDLGLTPGGPVDRAIAHALSIAPADRPTSAVAFADAFEAALRAEGLITTVESARSTRDLSRSHDLAVDGAVLQLWCGPVEDADPRAVDDALDTLALHSRARVAAAGGTLLGPFRRGITAIFTAEAARDPLEVAVSVGLELRATARGELSGGSSAPSSSGAPSGSSAPIVTFALGAAVGRLRLLTRDGELVLVSGAPMDAVERLRATDSELRVPPATWRHLADTFEGTATPGGPALVHRRLAVPRLSASLELYGVSIPCFGRDEALQALSDELLAARRRARAVVVRGPSGVGKSRLVRELCARHDRAPSAVIVDVGRCRGADGAPYEPIASVLRARAGIEDADPPDIVWLKLDYVVRRYLPDATGDAGPGAEAMVRELVGLLGASAPSRRRISLESESDRTVLFSAVAEYYAILAAKQTVVLVIEDAERIDAATTALITHLAEHLDQASVLIILVSTEAVTVPGATTIALGPLPADATSTLARELLNRVDGRPAWLVSRLAERAAGLPGALIEGVHRLVDDGILVVGKDGWTLAATAAEATSSTVVSEAERRLDAIEPGSRAILDAAAIAGERVWPSLLTELTGRPVSASELAELTTRGLLTERREVPILGEHDYGLASVELAARLLERIPPDRQREGHRRIGDWLERTAGQRPGRHDEAIARHFEDAGLPARAMPYALRAARHAAATHAARLALQRLARCSRLLEALPRRALTEFDRADMLLEVAALLGVAGVAAGELAQVIAATEHVAIEPAASARHHWATAWIMRARALEHLGRYDDALAAFKVVADGLVGVDEHHIAHLRAVVGAASMRSKLGDHAACLADLLPILEGLDDPDEDEVASDAHRIAGNAALRLRQMDVAQVHYARALERARDAAAPLCEVDALNALGAFHYFSGDTASAESTWAGAIAIAERWQLDQHRAVLLNNLGELLVLRGAYPAAEAALRQAEALHNRFGSDEGLADTGRLLAECALARGDTAAALALAERSVEAARRIGSPLFIEQCSEILTRITNIRAPEPS